jgi:phosphoserine aminotransferase
MPGTPNEIVIPKNLLPADGRFGCGPSKVRPEALSALAETGTSYLGTSHRQATVKNMVGRLRAGLREFFPIPDGYEIALGNGGSTYFWDTATFALIEQRSQHLVCGEFSSKFAEAASAAPFLGTPTVIESAPGTRPAAVAEDGIDSYCLVQNETSTGVSMPILRPANTSAANNQLVLVDATSGAGGLPVNLSESDCYYFAPQKCFAADGGLWVAVMSPAAVDRVGRIAASDRWIPASMDLTIALDNSSKDQTYNTPALATIFLFVHQLEWMNSHGGLAWASARCAESSAIMYQWAESRPWATPFVTDPADRSAVVATIDLDGVDATVVSGVLRRNGIVDTDSYRKLGRNQLRVALFPAIDPSDVQALTASIDYVVEQLS